MAGGTSSAVKKHIALIGMMGAGKSAVGRLLAQQLEGRRFYDTDAYIEMSMGKTVTDIFSDIGEAGFRQLESDALHDIMQLPTANVIATGGGVVLMEKNRALLRENALVFYLASPPEVLATRLRKNEAKRPLLAKQKDVRAILQELCEKRDPLYRQTATMTVALERESATAQEVVDKILKWLSVNGQ